MTKQEQEITALNIRRIGVRIHQITDRLQDAQPDSYGYDTDTEELVHLCAKITVLAALLAKQYVPF